MCKQCLISGSIYAYACCIYMYEFQDCVGGSKIFYNICFLKKMTKLGKILESSSSRHDYKGLHHYIL